MMIKHKKNNQRGFTLIEVLIALLILAIGVLGIAALQFKALKYSKDSFLRSQINFLAYDIADRMRANRTNATDYTGNYTVPTNTANNACVQNTGANAANDLGCWRNTVDIALPPGSTANITESAGLYTVSLGWTNREGETRVVTYTFNPGS